MRQILRFYKTTEDRWYIDLPEWQGSIADLEMVEGADTMLDKVSDNTDECYLDMSDEPFEGADEIKLVEDLTYSIGGGDYIMPIYKGEVIDHKMWLCSVTVEVFRKLPAIIYVGYPNL